MKRAPIIIGVCGGSCSGKTYFANKLIDTYSNKNFSLLKQDNYYKDLSNIPKQTRAKNNFDHPNAIDHNLLINHLKKLIIGGKINSPLYDFENHTRIPSKKIITPSEVIIIEGILIFYFEKLRKLIDISIFIDTPKKIRLERRLKRDIEKRGRTKNSITKQFFSTVQPMHNKYIKPYKKFSNIIVSRKYKNEIYLQLLNTMIKKKNNKIK